MYFTITLRGLSKPFGSSISLAPFATQRHIEDTLKEVVHNQLFSPYDPLVSSSKELYSRTLDFNNAPTLPIPKSTSQQITQIFRDFKKIQNQKESLDKKRAADLIELSKDTQTIRFYLEKYPIVKNQKKALEHVLKKNQNRRQDHFYKTLIDWVDGMWLDLLKTHGQERISRWHIIHLREIHKELEQRNALLNNQQERIEKNIIELRRELFDNNRIFLFPQKI